MVHKIEGKVGFYCRDYFNVWEKSIWVDVEKKTWWNDGRCKSFCGVDFRASIWVGYWEREGDREN